MMTATGSNMFPAMLLQDGDRLHFSHPCPSMIIHDTHTISDNNHDSAIYMGRQGIKLTQECHSEEE